MKLGDRILNKIADTLLSKIIREDYELKITVKAKKGGEDEND